MNFMKVNFSLIFLLSVLTVNAQNEYLKESVNALDLSTNNYMQQELAPIRKEFARINSTELWSTIEEVELYLSTEGGIAKIYKQDETIRKITVRNYGEMFQSLDEYYLEEGDLIFCLEQMLKYNRPIYYDEEAILENNDDQVFDPALSELQEYRNYFIEGELVHQIDNHDCGSPFNDEYLRAENERIWADFIVIMEAIDENSNQSERSLIGVWQGIPVIGSGWSDNYQFFEDGSFNFNHNQMMCDDSVFTESGSYQLESGILTLQFQTITFLTGAELEPSSGSCASEFELVGGTVITKESIRTEAYEWKFVSPLLDFDYLERALLDGSELFRMMHDPNDY